MVYFSTSCFAVEGQGCHLPRLRGPPGQYSTGVWLQVTEYSMVNRNWPIPQWNQEAKSWGPCSNWCSSGMAGSWLVSSNHTWITLWDGINLWIQRWSWSFYANFNSPSFNAPGFVEITNAWAKGHRIWLGALELWPPAPQVESSKHNILEHWARINHNMDRWSCLTPEHTLLIWPSASRESIVLPFEDHSWRPRSPRVIRDCSDNIWSQHLQPTVDPVDPGKEGS